MKKNLVVILAVFASTFFVSTCAKSSVNLPATSYVGAASVGDLVEVEVSGNKLTASFTEGKYQGLVYTDTLSLAPGFGKYVYVLDGSPTTSVVITDDLLIYESQELDSRFGVALPTQRQKYEGDISGKYNVVTLQNNVASSGTFEVNAAKKQWISGDTADLTKPTFSGTWTDKDGVIEAILEKIDPAIEAELAKYGIVLVPNTKFANVVFANGLIVIDFTQLNGFGIGAKQEPVILGSADGYYDVLVTGAPTILSANVSGKTVSVQGKTSILEYNQPSIGFIGNAEMEGILVSKYFFAVGSENGSGYALVAIKK